MCGAKYDAIGQTYGVGRRTDARIQRRIDAALGDARTVVNVGAGTGSYEPTNRDVTAVEPSAVMRAQRSMNAAPCIDAVAENLPFADGAFDAAMAILTVHHWTDLRAGGAELRRVARRVVVLSWDPAYANRLWLGPEYFPSVWDDDVARFPTLEAQIDAVGATEVQVVAVPHDCADGFLGAYWRRPAAYLDAAVRASISTFSLTDHYQLEDGLRRLADDLASGSWAQRHADLLDLDELDLGYRLLVNPANDGRGLRPSRPSALASCGTGILAQPKHQIRRARS